MDMPRLRGAVAGLRPVRKQFALDHGDRCEVVGQDARGEQSGYAPADHYGMPT